MTLPEVMRMVLHHPTIYLGKADLQLLEVFINGFGYAYQTPSPLLLLFENFICQEHNLLSIDSWHNTYRRLAQLYTIKEDLPEWLTDVAFTLFTKDWEKFIKTNPKIPQPQKYRSIDDT